MRRHDEDAFIENDAWRWLANRLGWFDRRAAASGRSENNTMPIRQVQLTLWNRSAHVAQPLVLAP